MPRWARTRAWVAEMQRGVMQTHQRCRSRFGGRLAGRLSGGREGLSLPALRGRLTGGRLQIVLLQAINQSLAADAEQLGGLSLIAFGSL